MIDKVLAREWRFWYTLFNHFNPNVRNGYAIRFIKMLISDLKGFNNK